MKGIPNISEAEWEVMKVLWRNSPIPANDVVEVLEDEMHWKPTTVKTLLSRLVKKGAVGFHQEGKTYYYFPVVSQEECVKAESRSFLKRIYGGALKPMLVNFLREEKLSQKDIEELKRILYERESSD